MSEREETRPRLEGERVASLPADQRCFGCGYDLRGQMVIRERHYRWFAVQCPECGRVAVVSSDLADMSGLRHSASGLAHFAALWCLVLFVGAAGALAGLAQSTAFAASAPFAERIFEAAWPHYPARSYSSGPLFTQISDDFWRETDRASLLRDAGGPHGAIDWWALADLLYYLPLTFVIAILWLLAAPHFTRRKWIGTSTAAIVLGAVGLGAYYFGNWGAWREWEYAITRAERMVGWPIAVGSYALGAVCFIAAIRLARPAARWLVRKFAGDRARPWFSGLWTEDGLEPPTVRGRPPVAREAP